MLPSPPRFSALPRDLAKLATPLSWTVKNDFLLTKQVNNTNLTLSIQSSSKKSHHSNLRQKIDFIEKTCPSNNFDFVRYVHKLMFCRIVVFKCMTFAEILHFAVLLVLQ